MNKGKDISSSLALFVDVGVPLLHCSDRNLFCHRYGGLSVGGQLPILNVEPKDIQNVFHQLGRMFNITGVILSLLSTLRVELIYSAHSELLSSQGHYSRLALREIGTFLHFMESEFNVKVRFGV